MPGGTYIQGPADQPSTTTISSFYLDKFEVTVGRFRNFWKHHAEVEMMLESTKLGQNQNADQDTRWKQFPDNGNRWTFWPPAVHGAFGPDDPNTWTEVPGPYESFPMNELHWSYAQAFCIWDGGYLPTEAEWTYAYVGGSEQRPWPWGSVDPNTALAVFDDGGPVIPFHMPLPVGSRPKGAARWGHLDMAGNAEEWIMDSYHTKFPPLCDHCVNLAPDEVTGNQYPTAKGGDFSSLVGGLEPAAREGDYADGIGHGFRCARPVGP